MKINEKTYTIDFDKAVQKYFDVYMTERNAEKISEMLMDCFCGIGTGADEFTVNKEEGMKIFRRDIDNAPNPLEYKIHNKDIQMIDHINALAVMRLDLWTRIMDQEVKLKQLRLMIMMHQESSGLIRIAGMHISFPSNVHEEDESYPLKELEDRFHVLKRMVAEETKTLREAYHELAQMINFDKLTGLASRHFMEEAMLGTWNRFDRFGRIYSMIMLDLDNFKEVNDIYGHDVGDQVLKKAAEVIESQLRSTDTACRWGGDEVVILLPETNLEESVVLSERISECMKESRWPKGTMVTASMGVGSIRRNETSDILLKRIDQALYRAKKSGKNCIEVDVNMEIDEE